MKSAIVTGATGMIGWNLIEHLISEKIYVLAIVNPDSKRQDRLKPNKYLRVLECDLRCLDDIEPIGKYECFFHLAWIGTYGKQRDDLELQLQNIRCAMDAVKLAKRFECEVFVGAGSQAEYGVLQKNEKLNAKTLTNPQTGYGIAKLSAGFMTRKLCEQLHIRHIWTRILSVYGPGDGKHTMVMSGIGDMLCGKKPKYTPAEQQWDYLYVKDAVRALYLMAEKGTNGKVYCLGSGQTRLLRDYIMDIRDATAPQIEPQIGALPYNDNQVMYLCADIEELIEDTGFIPMYDFKRGIEETVSWYRSELEI